MKAASLGLRGCWSSAQGWHGCLAGLYSREEVAVMPGGLIAVHGCQHSQGRGGWVSSASSSRSPSTSPAHSRACTPARPSVTLPPPTVGLNPTEHYIPWSWPQERTLRTEGPKRRPQRMVPSHQPICAPLLNNTWGYSGVHSSHVWCSVGSVFCSCIPRQQWCVSRGVPD